MKGADILTEEKVIEAELKLWQQLPVEYQPDIYTYINKKYKGNFEAFAKACVENSIFGTEANFQKYLDKPSQKAFDNDPLYQYFSAILSVVIKYQTQYMDMQGKFDTPLSDFDILVEPSKPGIFTNSWPKL